MLSPDHRSTAMLSPDHRSTAMLSPELFLKLPTDMMAIILLPMLETNEIAAYAL